MSLALAALFACLLLPSLLASAQTAIPGTPPPLPANFTFTQRSLFNQAQEYYQARRLNEPHPDCRPVNAQTPLHFMCLPHGNQVSLLQPSELVQLVGYMQQMYPDNGPEGGMTVTSYMPTPGFTQHGQLQFEADVNAQALFWTLEHGVGCVQGMPNTWCVSIGLQAPQTLAQMRDLLVQPAPPPAVVDQMAKQNVQVFDAQAKAEVKQSKEQAKAAQAAAGAQAAAPAPS